MEKKVNIYNVWDDFKNKLVLNNLKANDFSDEMRPYLMYLLCGKKAQNRRNKFINSSFEIIDGEIRKSILLTCFDDNYRFDFEINRDKWKLCFIECVTLPLNNINEFPYNKFDSLPDKENWIRAEKTFRK